MNWELFYLVCFVVGVAFSFVVFFSGALHLHLHLPKHFHVGSFHAVGGAHSVGHASGGHIAKGGVAKGGAAKGGDAKGGAHFSFFNPMTMAAFLAWFGGCGYLLLRFEHIWIFAGLAIATGAGLVGAGIVFWFVAKVLMANERDLDPLDYEMVGVLGRVSNSIRAGGTGEIIFQQAGALVPSAARSENGEPLVKGEEVVVTRYERGIAYVRRWQDFADSAGILAGQ
ncbi:MAG TPA: hypothetical protein VKZ53_15020 [Candidatus Angelobacter sp.]|nr:hypothetical protein [Candidatus Angelobacter sp.]